MRMIPILKCSHCKFLGGKLYEVERFVCLYPGSEVPMMSRDDVNAGTHPNCPLPDSGSVVKELNHERETCNCLNCNWPAGLNRDGDVADADLIQPAKPGRPAGSVGTGSGPGPAVTIVGNTHPLHGHRLSAVAPNHHVTHRGSVGQHAQQYEDHASDDRNRDAAHWRFRDMESYWLVGGTGNLSINGDGSGWTVLGK